MPSWRRLVVAGLKPIKRKKILIIEKEEKRTWEKIYIPGPDVVRFAARSGGVGGRCGGAVLVPSR